MKMNVARLKLKSLPLFIKICGLWAGLLYGTVNIAGYLIPPKANFMSSVLRIAGNPLCTLLLCISVMSWHLARAIVVTAVCPQTETFQSNSAGYLQTVDTGDIIVSVNGSEVFGRSIYVIDRILDSDTIGNSLNITVLRKTSKFGLYSNNDKLDDLRVDRLTEVSIMSTSKSIFHASIAWRITNAKSLYIKLHKFTEKTCAEIQVALESYYNSPDFSRSTKKKSGIILDLRGNGGGSLASSIRIASLFLNAGKVVSVLQKAHYRSRSMRQALAQSDAEPGNKKDLKMRTIPDLLGTKHRSLNIWADINTPLLILVDETSASASEILAWALQDNGRATVWGRRSFGKDIAQVNYRL